MNRKLLFGTTLACALLAGCSDDSISGGLMKQACNVEGETTCSQIGERLQCINGFYEILPCNENQSCHNGACTDRCDPDKYAASCNGDTQKLTCSYDGFIESEACPSGLVCVKGICVDSTMESCDTSYQPQCRDDSTRTQCKGGYVVSTTCEPGTICRNGMCNIATQCDSATFQGKCSTNFNEIACVEGIETSRPCAEGLLCINGQCTDNCSEEIKICASNGLSSYSCVDGKVQIQPCASNQKCTGGVCEDTTNCDDSFQSTCVDGKVQKCSNGVITTIPCASNQECFNGSCVSDPPCDPATFTPVCASSKSSQYCGANGYKTTIECTGNEVCEGGLCQTLDTPCTEGAVECKANSKGEPIISKTCIDGVWHEKYCDFATEICSAGICQDKTTVEKCSATEAKPSCDQNVALICENGYLSKYDCGEKHHCEAGVCYEDITEGDPCDPNTFVQQCIDSQNVYICLGNVVTAISCGDKVCDAGACIEPKCDTNNFQAACDGNFAYTACKNGILSKENCPENTYCANGTCKPNENEGDPCDPNTFLVKCDSNGKHLECQKGEDDKYTVVAVECPENSPICINNTCVQCDPANYQLTCTDGKKWTCEVDGTLKDTLCPTDKNICYNNDCAECDPTQTAKSCTGTNTYKQCNANGLFEEVACPTGFSCDAGSCTNACDDDHPCGVEHYVCDEGQCKFQAECVNAEPASCKDDNTIQTCVNELYEYTACKPSEICKNGKCMGNECDPETYGTQCNTKTSWATCDNGYLKPTACSGTDVCKDGKCMGDQCDPATFGTQCKDDGVTKTMCTNGYIVDFGVCSGTAGICIDGNCVECDSSKTSVKCLGTAQYQVCEDTNKYSAAQYCDTSSETCKDGKGCVSKCDEDFHNHCENGKRVYCDGSTTTIKTEDCPYNESCVDGTCKPRNGQPCSIHEFNNVCHPDSGNVYLEYCSQGGQIQFSPCGTNSFCGAIEGLTDCYVECDTLDQSMCLWSSNGITPRANIGKCRQGTKIKPDGTTESKLGIYELSGICEDNMSLSCHLDKTNNHVVFDYFFCSSLNGGTCTSTTGSCGNFSLGSCSKPDGTCVGTTATSCVYDPSLGGNVLTTMDCSKFSSESGTATCGVYKTSEGNKVARCVGSNKLNFNGTNYTVSSLGTCVDSKTLATLYWSGNGITGRSSKCTNTCVPATSDTLAYCK